MKGNFNILSGQEIKDFENKYKAEKIADNNEYILIIAGERFKTIHKVENGLTLRIANEKTGGLKHFKINSFVLNLYLSRYHDLNKTIFKWLNIYVSIVQLQNTVNSLKEKNIEPNIENIEQYLFSTQRG